MLDTFEGTRLTDASWQRVRAIVKNRDGATCQYCGRQDVNGEVDHILPLSRGGNDTLENLVWACQEYNRLKGHKTPREFIKYLTGKAACLDGIAGRISEIQTKGVRPWLTIRPQDISVSLPGVAPMRSLEKMQELFLERTQPKVNNPDDAAYGL